ncbi:MAG: phasin family protein [Candidatus Competibacteraceae bacterium]
MSPTPDQSGQGGGGPGEAAGAGHLVDSLVREGEKLRDQALKMTEEKSGKIKGWVGEARGRLGDIKDKTSSTLDSLEQLFEERVARALTRLGVPTRDELQVIASVWRALIKRIQAIANQREVAVMTARTEGEKDDLKMINGIGPALEGKLNAAGFCAYRQIVNLTDADINRLEAEVIHLSGRIRRDTGSARPRRYTFENTGTKHCRAWSDRSADLG